MQPLQCKLTERLIAEIIFQGEMEMLQRQMEDRPCYLGIPKGKKVIPSLL